MVNLLLCSKRFGIFVIHSPSWQSTQQNCYHYTTCLALSAPKRKRWNTQLSGKVLTGEQKSSILYWAHSALHYHHFLMPFSFISNRLKGKININIAILRLFQATVASPTWEWQFCWSKQSVSMKFTVSFQRNKLWMLKGDFFHAKGQSSC